MLAQKTGEDILYFQYDENDIPVGFVLNDTQYFYITNLSGDIVGITDSSGELIAEYSYDEWGKLLSITTSRENNAEQLAIAEINPLRYRGYYYDTETGYYYLQSRYYDLSICKFINADLPEYAQMQKDEHTGNNLFAYCGNNPVNHLDDNGYWKAEVHNGYKGKHKYYSVSTKRKNIIMVHTTGRLNAVLKNQMLNF